MHALSLCGYCVPPHCVRLSAGVCSSLQATLLRVSVRLARSVAPILPTLLTLIERSSCECRLDHLHVLLLFATVRSASEAENERYLQVGQAVFAAAQRSDDRVWVVYLCHVIMARLEVLSDAAGSSFRHEDSRARTLFSKAMNRIIDLFASSSLSESDAQRPPTVLISACIEAFRFGRMELCLADSIMRPLMHWMSVATLYAADREDETAEEGEARRQLPLALLDCIDYFAATCLNGISFFAEKDMYDAFTVDTFRHVLYPLAGTSALLTQQLREELGSLCTTLHVTYYPSNHAMPPVTVALFECALATAVAYGGVEDGLARCVIRALHHRVSDDSCQGLINTSEATNALRLSITIKLLPQLLSLLHGSSRMSFMYDTAEEETSGPACLIRIIRNAIDTCDPDEGGSSRLMHAHVVAMCGEDNATLHRIESEYTLISAHAPHARTRILHAMCCERISDGLRVHFILTLNVCTFAPPLPSAQPSATSRVRTSTASMR
jgi:hypothetical protein